MDDLRTFYELPPVMTQRLEAEAKRLGTYPISIIPDQDCCTLFTPRNPLTRARLADIEAAEAALAIDTFAAQAVEGAVVEDFEYPLARTAAAAGKAE